MGSIGAGQLRFPTSVAIAGGELYVADQLTNRVEVFDLSSGNFQRSLGGDVSQGMMGYKWKGRFIRLQSVAVDGQGRVHALDSHMGIIQILDAQTGGWISHYGTEGTGEGQLRLPEDIAIIGSATTAVANTLNRRIEVLSY